MPPSGHFFSGPQGRENKHAITFSFYAQKQNPRHVSAHTQLHKTPNQSIHPQHTLTHNADWGDVYHKNVSTNITSAGTTNLNTYFMH